MLYRMMSIILFFIISTSAFPMGMTYLYTFMSWSPDGKWALIHRYGGGPEGGRSIDYFLVSADPYYSEIFEISNTLSPGDGSTKENIKDKICASHLKQLKEKLKSCGMSRIDVSVKPELKNREDCVRIPGEMKKMAEQTVLHSAGKNRFTSREYHIAIDPGVLSVKIINKPMTNIAVPGIGAAGVNHRIYSGPGNHLIFIFAEDPYNEISCILTSVRGDFSDLKVRSLYE